MTDGAIWCEMDWRPTLLGRLMGQAFQTPYCDLDVFAADGSAPTKYRVIPAMARAGFLLGPTVGTPEDFLRVLAGVDLRQRPVAMAIHPNGSFRWLMQAKVRYRLYKMPPLVSPTDAAQATALLQTSSQ